MAVSNRRVPVNALFFHCRYFYFQASCCFGVANIIEAFTIVTTISALLFHVVGQSSTASYVQYRHKASRLTRKNPHAECLAAMLPSGSIAFFCLPHSLGVGAKPDAAVATPEGHAGLVSPFSGWPILMIS